MAKFPGLYKLCFRYLLPGCNEIIKSIFYPLAVRDLQKFIPEISYKDVRRLVVFVISTNICFYKLVAYFYEQRTSWCESTSAR